MQIWNVLHAARWKYRTQKSRQNSLSGHNPTTLSGYIFATKARIDNRKNLLSSDMSSTCPHNIANIGPLAAEMDPVVWGTPTNFNGFRVLAALLHGTPVVSISTLCGVEQRAPPIFGRRPSRCALAHISSSFIYSLHSSAVKYEENVGLPYIRCKQQESVQQARI